MMWQNGIKNVKNKKLPDYYKKCKKIYNDCDLYLENKRVMKNTYFNLSIQNGEKSHY